MHQPGSGGLTRLLEDPVFEVFPAPGVEEQVALLPRGARVSVTSSPAKGIDATVALTESLCGRGAFVVPHISARLVTDHGHLRSVCRRLAGMGVDEIFVIGGDARHPAGPFSSAYGLLEAMAELEHGFKGVGVAAYPEGHPFLPNEALWQHLERKQPLATYTVTQMCFDAEAIAEWVQQARRRGIFLPVVIGVPGVVQRKRLLRLALKIGVGDSTRFIAKHAEVMARMLGPGRYSPQGLVTELSRAAGDRQLGLGGLHIYTFNQVEGTERWRRQILSSSGGERGAGS